MSRSTINFLLDGILLIGFALLMGTQLILHFVFPPASQAAGWLLWGFNHDQWSTAGFLGFAVVALGILVHVMLHWSWVCGFVTTRLARRRGRPVVLTDGERTLIGVCLLVGVFTVVGAIIAVAYLTVQSPR